MGSLLIRGKQKRITIRTRYMGSELAGSSPYSCERDGKKDCKCRSCINAGLWLGEIERKIDEGTFDISVYFPNAKAVKKKLGLAPINPDITFGEYSRKVLDAHREADEDSGFKKYKQVFHLYATSLNDMPMKNIKRLHIQEVANTMISKGLTAKTIKCHMGNLSNAFNYAVEDDIIAKNPCRKVKLPNVPDPDPDPFTVSEVLDILEWIGDKHPSKVAFYAIGFYSGMRPGEILGLKWESIDFKREEIKVARQHTNNEEVEHTKTKKIRTIDIIPQLMPYLLEHRQYTFMKSDYLFLNQYDQPYLKSEDFCRYYYKPCLKAIGARYRTLEHMRHTFACLMLNNGQPPNWIAKRMLGHTNTKLLFSTYGNYWNDLAPAKSSFDFLNRQLEVSESETG